MDLRTAFDVLRRRWRPVVAGLLLTAAVAAGVCFTVRAQYQATGNLVLLSGGSTISDNPTENGVSNPYGEFGGTLNATASIIQTVVTSEAVERRLVRDGATGTFELTLSTQSPQLVVVAKGSSAVEAVGTARLVMKEINHQLVKLQTAAGAPEQSFIRTDVLSLPTNVTKVRGPQLRALTAVLALGVLLSISLGFAAESWARRRGEIEDDADLADSGTDGGDQVVGEATTLTHITRWDLPREAMIAEPPARG